jgi:hypothetical protein
MAKFSMRFDDAAHRSEYSLRVVDKTYDKEKDYGSQR